MHILYVDESGTEDLGVEPRHFVLLGLATRAEHWKEYDSIIETIKEKYCLRGIEIHTAWMARRYVEQEKIPGFAALNAEERRRQAEQEMARRAGVLGIQSNQKKLAAYRVVARKITPYLHLTRQERRQCLVELARQIGSWGNTRIFAEAIRKSAITAGKVTPYEQGFEQVMTRYQAFLERVNDMGIVVHDNNSKVAPRLMTLTRKFHNSGTLFRMISNIVETPLFVDSTLTSMIQLADLAAYALRRFLENGENDLWDPLRSRVDQVNGVHVGVRHYTGKAPCDCQVCRDHGRRSV